MLTSGYGGARGSLSTRLAIAAWAGLMAWTAAAGLEAAEPSRYDLDVELAPARRHVGVSGQVAVHVEEGESNLTFSLYEGFRITRCAIDGHPAAWSRAESGRRIEVQLPDRVSEGFVTLDISYAGQLNELPGWGTPDVEGPFMDDAAGPDRVELALYSAWYPSFGFGPTYDVEIDLAIPKGWIATCIGERTDRDEGSGETKTHWVARAINDIVIIASPRLVTRTVETAAGVVRVHHTRLPESYLLREVRETEQTLLLFIRHLGEASGGATLQHVYSPREWGQGFARPGMIVVSEGRALRALQEDPATSSLYGHAHEAGHFWWRFGYGQGDWINETFAEYFALVAIQNIQGETQFQKALAERRDTAMALPADAPSIAQVRASNEGDGYTIRYMKGALMLDAFRARLGDEAFFKTCRSFYDKIKTKKAGTEDFRAHWRQALGDNDLLSAWLDSPGSTPLPPVE